ncbi:MULTISPECIES: hypothetical protein [unclassified Brevundimonas]|uniref:hypothetical protein n=1 Tax=unclassified Brevundimonas TaxID=2622653 RepID=UPI003F8EE2B2
MADHRVALSRLSPRDFAATLGKQASSPSIVDHRGGLDESACIMANIKLHEITARNTPAGHNPITMAAHVVGLLPQGGRRVRLANNHELDVLGVGDRQSEVSLIGDVVAVTLGPGQLHGWRLASL